MALYLLRDYQTQNTTFSGRTFVTSYLTAIFLRRILGYSYVGDTNYPIQSIGQLLVATGDSTPTTTPTFSVGTKAGITNNGAAIEVSIPFASRAVSSTDVSRMLWLKSTAYPTRNSGCFLITGLQQGNTTTIAAGSNGNALPQSTINVASTTGFPSSGTIFVGTSTGISSSSNNVVLPQTTLNVTSTTGFATSGTITVQTVSGPQTVTYTGVTATTFTGCTGGTARIFTGYTVYSGSGIQSITYTGTTSTTFTGCSGGSGTLATSMQVFNQNKYVIDYRGNGDTAMTEAADTLPWYLYEKEALIPTNGAVNTAGSTQYRGSGNSTTPRIILQSPHAMNWQVRICNETDQDASSNGTCPYITFAPGFSGNSAGDFTVNGRHLHTAQFFDTNDINYTSGLGAGDNAGAGAIYRYTIFGDDTGQNVAIFARRPLNATSPPSFFVTFGIPNNEPTPLPIDDVSRLFVIGNALSTSSGNGRLSDINLAVGHFTNNAIQGTTFGLYIKTPKSCAPSLITYVTGVNQNNGPQFDSLAGDTPFTSSTELLPIDLVTGTVPNWNNSSAGTTYFPFEPRIMGTMPFTMNGRANFAEYSLTTDNATWSVSTTSGNGVSPIQITTTATNNLVTGQTVAINGVGGNTAANGTFVVTVINSTQFTLNSTTGNGAFTSGGTVLRGASIQHMRRGIYIPWNGPSVVP